MRIESAQRVSGIGKPRRREGSGGQGGFSLGNAEESGSAARASASAAVTSIDALIALQAVEGNEGQREKAVRRGRDLLDLLDAMKLDMMAGYENPAALQQLRALAAASRNTADGDPGLQDVLDAIDLRAAVELAKREN